MEGGGKKYDGEKPMMALLSPKGVEAEAVDDRRGDLERRQLAVALEEVLAALVLLADDDGAAAGFHVEQRVF